VKLVVLERPADLTTPVAVMRTLLEDDAPAFLLESVEQGERIARWSFLGTAPSRQISGRDGDPFAALRSVPHEAPSAPGEDLPPFTGGAVGYLGYDAVRRLERIPSLRPDPIGLPDAWFGVFDRIIAFDHVKHRLLFLGHAEPGGEAEARSALSDLAARVEAGRTRRPGPVLPEELEWTESMPRGAFMDAVDRAKEHILAGDIFQVVLSRRWSAPFPGDPFPLYRALRRISPSPYQYYLRTPHAVLLGASPERLVRAENRADGTLVDTVPLAGTRPRGRDAAEDLAFEADLLADEKERAEHVMLVDLGRNDLGRVSAPGTVEVREFFTVERFSHVMHIASRVFGTLAPGRDAIDALAATFPAGTLSGAPKIRAMEIIEELEPVRRGAYGGAIGYVDFAGNLDMAIAIRTAVVTGGMVHVQAGAGVVADSVPEKEADECENKAKALMRAVERSREYEG
jgi:anthranilate synthase component 1